QSKMTRSADPGGMRANRLVERSPGSSAPAATSAIGDRRGAGRVGDVLGLGGRYVAGDLCRSDRRRPGCDLCALLDRVWASPTEATALGWVDHPRRFPAVGRD